MYWLLRSLRAIVTCAPWRLAEEVEWVERAEEGGSGKALKGRMCGEREERVDWSGETKTRVRVEVSSEVLKSSSSASVEEKNEVGGGRRGERLKARRMRRRLRDCGTHLRIHPKSASNIARKGRRRNARGGSIRSSQTARKRTRHQHHQRSELGVPTPHQQPRDRPPPEPTQERALFSSFKVDDKEAKEEEEDDEEVDGREGRAEGEVRLLETEAGCDEGGWEGKDDSWSDGGDEDVEDWARERSVQQGIKEGRNSRNRATKME